MTRRYLVVLVSVCLLAAFAYGEAQRTVFTHENKTPAARQLEVGIDGLYREFQTDFAKGIDGHDEYTFGPYVRYGVFENLSVNAGLPFMYVDRSGESSEQGLGDASVGFEFVAWQDLFEYPYILPHATITFPTGDEDKGLGEGKSRTQFGVSVGTTVNDVLHFVVDASYTIYRNRGNEVSFGGSLIWDLSPQFSLLAEVLVIDDRDKKDDGNNPIYGLGGMSYRANEHLMFTVYGGGSRHSDEDVIAGAKVAYSF